MRADARRNRELIVRAAIKVFTTAGECVSMEDIARAAGLGVGTLYRHFPDRAALLALISCDVVSRLTAGLEAAPADLPRWDVLLDYVRAAVLEPFAMLKAVPIEDPVVAQPVARLHEALHQVIKGAQDEGSLRADVEPAAVIELLSLVVCRPGASAEDALAKVVLAGLRA
ncbi:TetR/AcrR family transcriptional regulator [Kutzneria sp. CA-103260]|uniref:TetR/AcrR family transcriptional regulator n=1 Tax=Kutzneria sp. CA-103260 TaxID=2802641 RepID=UPI001BAB41B2|nr:TetR/AcrR family transcriptional regulator [Kutzneria sp. CA-103260]QUQ70860.1 TetR/AcrR family transcriptional regulator [Kutzneria sp. CA-103260]